MKKPVPGLDAELAAAARLEALIPDAVLVGGTAAALHAAHRVSLDDDHDVTDLRGRFDAVLAALEETAGWVTARVQRPVLILGRLDGIETGIRNLIRSKPFEIEEVPAGGHKLRVPTLEGIARIKAWLCLMRNATRDYLDFAALADRLGEERASRVVAGMDEYYTDQQGPGGRRIATQVAKRLSEPRPDDLTDVDLRTYRRLERRLKDWGAVTDACRRVAVRVLDRFAEEPSRSTGTSTSLRGRPPRIGPRRRSWTCSGGATSRTGGRSRRRSAGRPLRSSRLGFSGSSMRIPGTVPRLSGVRGSTAVACGPRGVRPRSARR
jgi:hypothetical protein